MVEECYKHDKKSHAMSDIPEASNHEQCMRSRTWENVVSRLESFGKPFRIFDDRAHWEARLRKAPILLSCYKPWRVRQHFVSPNNSFHLFITASLCIFGSETSHSFFRHSFILYIL
jgi:hypothetical protein